MTKSHKKHKQRSQNKKEFVSLVIPGQNPDAPHIQSSTKRLDSSLSSIRSVRNHVGRKKSRQISDVGSLRGSYREHSAQKSIRSSKSHAVFYRKFESENDLSHIRKMFQKMKRKAYMSKKEKIEVKRIKSTSMVEENRKK